MQPNADIAHSALEQWGNGKYRDCLSSLKQIESSLNKGDANTSGEDGGESNINVQKAKLEHNMALAEYVQHSGSNPAAAQVLINKFKDVSSRLEDEVKGGSGTDDSSGKEDAPKKVKFQPDSSFALYNQAVVYVYTRKWKSALTLLEDLVMYIDAVDEGLAVCICFLLLDVYTSIVRGSGCGDGGLLLGHIVEKAQTVIDYLEKPHCFNGYQDWSSASSDGASGSKKGETNETNADGANMPKSFSPSQITNVQHRLNSYKLKLVLIQASISSAKAEAKASAVALSEMKKPASSSSSNSNENEAEKWQGLKLSASKENDSAQEEEDFTAMFACLKANMEYLNGSYDEAYKLLQSASDNVPRGVFWNNIGCIHHMLGQHNCASMYFAKALDMDSKRTSGESIMPEVAFNLGVQLLHCNRSSLAYECFMKSASSNYHRPRLWLHIAECVVMTHAQNGANSKSILRCVTGEGASRRIFLNTMEERAGEGDQSKSNKLIPLSVGLRATVHVLFLLNKAETESVVGHSSMLRETARKDEKEEDSSNVYSNTNGSAIVLESDADQCRQQALAMRQTALLCRAYLALCTEDYALAFDASQQVIQLASSSGSSKKLSTKSDVLSIAHSYCAEALLRLPMQEQESKRVLDHIVQAMETESSGTSEPETRCSLCINVALLRLLKDDLQEAERLLLRALDVLPDSPHAIRLLVYLCLRRGEQDRARRLLKTSR